MYIIVVPQHDAPRVPLVHHPQLDALATRCIDEVKYLRHLGGKADHSICFLPAGGDYFCAQTFPADKAAGTVRKFHPVVGHLAHMRWACLDNRKERFSAHEKSLLFGMAFP